MSNTLLESLWARVSANIGDRINQAQELLTKALAANTESKAARDAAATSASEAAGHADRAEQATDVAGLRNEVTQQLADLVDGAPADLDTIREVAEYAQANRGVTDQLNAAIGNKADKSHTHTTAQVTGLDSALSGKANASHTHTQAQVTGLSTALNGKANTSHTHAIADISNLPLIRTGTAGGAIVQRQSNAQITVPVTPQANNDAASKSYVDARPALFSGSGAPPSSISGAVVGDWWLDTSTMELHKITGV